MSVAFVNAQVTGPGTGTSMTISITVSGTNPALVVGASLDTTTATVTSVSWSLGSGTTVQIASANATSGPKAVIWAVPAPGAGAGTLTVNFSASVTFNGMASVFSDAHQTTPCPIGDAVTSLSNATPVTLTPTNLIAADGSFGYGTNTVGGNWSATTPNQRAIDNSSSVGFIAGDATGTTGVTFTNDGNMNAGNVALAAARVQQATAGGDTLFGMQCL